VRPSSKLTSRFAPTAAKRSELLLGAAFGKLTREAAEACDRLSRAGIPLNNQAVLLKGINDDHGHASGDAAIRLVATAFKSILRETDIVARWSGDEFVALLSDGDPMAADLIDERLAAAIASQGSTDLPYVVSATVGTSGNGNTFPQTYDALGRYVFVRASVDF